MDKKKIGLLIPVVAVVAIGGYFIATKMMREQFSKNCATVLRASCKAHREAGCTQSGDYSVSLGESNKTYTAYCDMEADGGGWMLALDYLHIAGSNPKLAPLSNADGLPVLRSSKLGDDGMKTKDWGHVSQDWLKNIPFTEMRFNCKTSGHERVLDFKLSDPACLEYFRTGKGSCLNVAKAGVPLKTNTANLPAAATEGFKDQGALAITNFPFFTGAHYHWGIAGEGARWECDDVPNGPFNSTQHLVFIR